MKKISTNCYKEEIITNVNDILRLSKEKKSIWKNNWGIKPASFYLHLPLIVILRMIEYRSLYFVHNSDKK